MLNMNNIFRVLMITALLWSCQSPDVPLAYRTPIAKTQSNPYGAWVIAELNEVHPGTDNSKFTGELISISMDSAYILVEDHHMLVIKKDQVSTMELCTHKNQAGTYGVITAVFLLPNIIGAVTQPPEYSGGFLLLGVPVAITGLILTIVEGSGQGNMLVYPHKSTWYDLKKFARFPAGIPEHVNQDDFTLKKEAR